MHTTERILEFLHGKKAIIVGISAVLITYFSKETIISDNLALALQSILAILGGGADILTNQKLGVHRK